MEEADRKTIRSNIVTLKRDMNFVDVYPGLLARDVFEKDHIQKFDSKPSDSEKNMALLMAIETRGPTAFTSLVESLVESKQVHLAELLGYKSSGSSQGQMVQAQATPHDNRPGPSGQPTKPVPPVPANDGHGDYSSTQKDALGSYPQAMMESNLVYKMKSKPRGLAIIINNKNFTTLKERTGTDVDRCNLKEMFERLEFKVFIHTNCTGKEIEEIIEQLRTHNHSRYDCFILSILSHGKEKDAIYGTDSDLVTLEYIMDQFGANRCPTLSGKPKLFFIQACRGEKYDEGVPVYPANGAETFQGPAGDNYLQMDSTDNPASTPEKMPCQSDMLLSYSTVPGYKAWRNERRGSWYIQALTEIINQYAREETLHRMLTMINDKVAKDFMSKCEKHYKQISAYTTVLRKELKFFPGQYE